ncbi:MAG: hypothetical protein US40_C0011G0046 [Candidatus Roizmanbacteria bacterium GW2011_GWC2_37_13]|uniref:Uncharacterized protein n=1 Tax=Candidatus Roizmanbacteria bacterium GW2011_GWC2_37_13 TaxID=1618486 RepID=A0A0G0JAC9_9BACT|nr:MAG: hypothetical protein US38_C0007G0046 [Candidatus Roizmanbacteria bacterium GW2011_GWC1_37_12]KKQ25161.1 MAG: hypothetical protein US40_C0011G0046 [Candidatus Roizmanbacteria bacterium GW2011_GWC2_37_13]
MQKLKSKCKSFFNTFNFLLVFLTFTFLLLTSKPLLAVSMESSRFRIESANTSSAAGNKSSDNYKLSDTIGQLAAGEFSSTGYVVKAGFQYLHSIIPFRFSISDINIALGTLTPNTSSTATTVLSVYFGGAGQYQVTAIEEGALKTLSGNSVPDTSCDGGAETCSESQAKTWSSSTAYGFGYNMSGNDVPADFISGTQYRPFPDRTAAESPVVIMSSSDVGKNRQSTMTFKANISPIQPAGSYQTIINFVATPSF